MQSSGTEVREFFKKIEADINRQFFSLVDSSIFVEQTAEALDEHVDILQEFRGLSEQWLKQTGLATIKDILVAARQLINFEDQLGRMDEILYLTVTELKEKRKKISRLTKEIAGPSDDYKKRLLEGT